MRNNGDRKHWAVLRGYVCEITQHFRMATEMQQTTERDLTYDLSLNFSYLPRLSGRPSLSDHLKRLCATQKLGY